MTSIAVFGAGNTGCHGGRRLAVAGSPQTSEIIATQGLDLSDYHGGVAHASPAPIAFRTEARAVATMDLVLVMVKSADMETAALAKPCLKPSAFVISLQNGLHHTEACISACPLNSLLKSVFHQPVNPALPSTRSGIRRRS